MDLEPIMKASPSLCSSLQCHLMLKSCLCCKALKFARVFMFKTWTIMKSYTETNKGDPTALLLKKVVATKIRTSPLKRKFFTVKPIVFLVALQHSLKMLSLIILLSVRFVINLAMKLWSAGINLTNPLKTLIFVKLLPPSLSATQMIMNGWLILELRLIWLPTQVFYITFVLTLA